MSVMRSLERLRARRRPVAGVLLSLLVLASVAPLARAGDLVEARETLANPRAVTAKRIAAAIQLMETDKRANQDKVVDALFDVSGTRLFVEALLPVVRPRLVDEAGALLPGIVERVRKLASSGQPEWQVHGLLLATVLECDGVDDEALELLEDTARTALRNDDRVPAERHSVRSELLALEVSCAVLARRDPPAPDYLFTLQRLRASPVEATRAIAYASYISLGADRYAEVLAGALADASRAIHLAAFEALVAARRPEVVPALIGLLAERSSAIDTLVLPELFRATGQRSMSRAQWQKWLDRSESFAVLDVSTSMGATLTRRNSGEGVEIFIPGDIPTKTRLSLVNDQMLNALEGLTDQEYHVITFSTEVDVWSPQGSRDFDSREQALASARAYIAGLRRRGGTAPYDGLKAGFQVDGVQEIFLLTDGAPARASSIRVASSATSGAGAARPTTRPCTASRWAPRTRCSSNSAPRPRAAATPRWRSSSSARADRRRTKAPAALPGRRYC